MISGIKANKNTAIISINKNGKTPFTISLNFKPVIEQAVNKLYPNGGVTYPITRLITKIIPKCNGSNPNCIPKGTRTGAKIIIAATVSIKAPTTKSININTIK